MIYRKLADNPLRSRADLQQAVRDLFEPVRPCFSTGYTKAEVGSTGAHYPDIAAAVESFSRHLWGLVPLAAGGGIFEGWSIFQKGLANGTDPSHPEYWGHITTTGQAHVEMAAIGLGLALVPQELWDPLSDEAKGNLSEWLNSINRVPINAGNWQFFRILTNLGLKTVGASHNESQVEETLINIEKMYLGDGWYADSIGGMRDYYVSFAIHFYSLVCAHLWPSQNPERTQRFRERSAIFARDFIYWQAPDGSSIPFGRSMTYRFAQIAFWSAMAFAKMDTFSPGVTKGLILRHLRWWFQQPIFSETGLLTIGYGYPNLHMAEDYNGPGSPYWALKPMLVLALPETDPFWTAEEEPMPSLEGVHEQPHARMILCRDEKVPHVVALCSSQVPDWPHSAEKYGKFAYSTYFGFNVPTLPMHLRGRGFDNTLALSEEGIYWRVREKNSEQRLEGGMVCSQWSPWADVEITSWVAPAWPWHVRIHRIKTARNLETAEGGFANRRSPAADKSGNADWRQGEGFAYVPEANGFSGILDLIGQRIGENVLAEPNSNLLYPRSVIPALRGSIAVGEHWVATGVLGHRGTHGAEIWEVPPDVEVAESSFQISYRGKHWEEVAG